MNGKEHKAYIKEIRDYKERLLKSDDEIKAFLKATGIYTKTGKLTSVYKQIKDNKENNKITSHNRKKSDY